eukprot:XP_001708812.1 Hypothetical protein GL50803_39496 [Giardia lamblia ATCC 50803]
MIASASLVLVTLSVSTTRGMDGTSAMRCPRASTRAALADAARADATAYLLWFRLTLRHHLLMTVVGWAM